MIVYLSMIETEDDRSRFEIIYHEYKRLMFYVANRILQNEYDSEDAVHQAFLKIAEIIEKIDDPKCPKTRSLVVTIVERKAIDQYRARKKQSRLSLDEEYINVPVADELEDVPARLHFAKAMALLPTRYRELLLLKYDCGYSDQEIAQMLSMSKENVKKTIQRAKAKLSAIMDEMELNAV